MVCGLLISTWRYDDVIAWLETLNDRKIDDMKNESYKIYEENFKVQVFDNKLKKLLENVI